MRLKTYTGRSMNEVMARLRKDLGPDAFIIRSEKGEAKGHVRVTAAYEDTRHVANACDIDATPAETPSADPKDGETTLAAALAYHRLPSVLTEKIQSVAASGEETKPTEALAQVFSTLFGFRGLCAPCEQPIILIGPPGAGKTVAVAKLAAEARLDGLDATILSADTVKSSGIEQLDHFARLMKLQVAVVATPDELALAFRDSDHPKSRLCLVDTPGINLNDSEDRSFVAGFIEATAADVALVLPAGMDAEEAAEAARAAADLGARGLIGTRLDVARRFGSLIAAADAGSLDFCGFGDSPYVADMIEPAYPAEFARRLMGRAGHAPATREKRIAS